MVLRQQLAEAGKLANLYNNEQFRDSLLPYLEKFSNVQPVEPKLYKTEEEFIYALQMENMRALTYKGLCNFLAAQAEIARKLSFQLENNVSFEIT